MDTKTTTIINPSYQTLINIRQSNRLPLAAPQSYYRSQIFTAHSGPNPLVAAAATLFVILQQLKQTQHYTQLDALQQQLIHEIRAFESYAQNQGYRSEHILLARYLLCATCDDIIQHTSWGSHQQWQNYQLLAVFHKENLGAERFFIILDRLKEDARIYIDLLELIYLCLLTGFIGSYRATNNHDELDKRVTQLYELIRWQRGELQKNLLVQAPAITVSAPKTTAITSTLGVTASITGILVSGGYIMLSYLLALAISPLQQQLLSLQQLTQGF